MNTYQSIVLYFRSFFALKDESTYFTQVQCLNNENSEQHICYWCRNDAYMWRPHIQRVFKGMLSLNHVDLLKTDKIQKTERLKANK